MGGRAGGRASQTRTFDEDNRLTAIEPNGATTNIVYDYKGARVKKTGASVTIYL